MYMYYKHLIEWELGDMDRRWSEHQSWGSFHDSKPGDPHPRETVKEGDTDGDTKGIKELRTAIDKANKQQAARNAKISRLMEQLEKQRYNKMCSLKCAQLAEFWQCYTG